MNKLLVVTAATLFGGFGVFAQDAPLNDPGPKVMMFQSTAAAPIGAVATSGMFFSAELPGNGKSIPGAPYAATASTETTQILGDGNRIVNKTTATLARDSQGRTRREETMGKVGPWQVNGPKLVFINDPVSQSNYVLDPDRQMATVLKTLGPMPGGPQPGTSISSTPALAGPDVTYVVRRPGTNQQDDAKTESLGVQSMEGVVVEGKRVTRTIPAGQIGNIQPIVTTSEVWFSPDLQVVVMSRHSDPRFGETVYQLVGIQRSEPDRSLFEVPSSYTIKNVPAPMPPRMGPGDVEPFQFGVAGTMAPIGK